MLETFNFNLDLSTMKKESSAETKQDYYIDGTPAYKFLGDGLKGLSSLRSFVVDYGQYPISDDGLAYLGPALSHLNLLEQLEIQASLRAVTNRGFISFFNSLKGFPMLKDMGIIFQDCIKLDHEAMKGLSDSFQYFNTVKNLHIKLSSCFRITNKWLVVLKEGTSHLTSLENLKLDIPGAAELTDTAFDHLKEGLEKIQTLKNLSLLFTGGVTITNRALKSVMDAAFNLPQLQKFYLDFSGCHRLTAKGLQMLKTKQNFSYDMKIYREKLIG
jgi:hypothetical protein